MNKNLFMGTLVSNGFTQEELASLIGISRVSMCKKVNGVSDFSTGEIRKIMKIIDINPEQLVSIFFKD